MREDKVSWTDDEKARIVARARDIRDGNPGLSGLPLLREAVKGLPADRQPPLVSLTQAPWFPREMGRGEPPSPPGP